MRDNNTIFETKDYNLFKMLEGNRQLDLNNLENIKKSISKKYIKNPITVNEKYEVIDGQHRLEALRQLDMPVHYILEKGLTIEDCGNLNCNSKNWTPIDYLNNYCKRGIESYIELSNFRNENPHIGLTCCIGFLNGKGKATKELMDKYRAGNFEITANIEDIQEVCNKIKIFDGTRAYKRTNFMYAAFIMINDDRYDHERMRKKVGYLANRLYSGATIYENLKMLEDIYNYRTNQKQVVYFTDLLRTYKNYRR